MPTKRSTFLLHTLGAFLVAFVLVGIPTFLVEVNAVSPSTADGNVSLGFIQLAALYVPALAIFTQVLLEFSYRREERSGKSGGVGIYGPDVFRWGVVFAAGASSLFLILGVIALIAALDFSPKMEAGVALIMIGMVIGPMMLIYVALLEFRDIK